MLISMLLILFLSIGMVAATNDISTDDAVSSDADSVTVDADLDIEDAPSVSDETLTVDLDKNQLQDDGEKKNTSFGHVQSKGTVNNCSYEVIYLQDDDYNIIKGFIDISVNDAITTTEYKAPIEYMVGDLQYGLNNISFIYNGSEIYNPCRCDFTIYRADYYPSFEMDSPDVYYGNDANITIKLLDKDDKILEEAFSAIVSSYSQDGTLLYNETFEIPKGEGNIFIPASELFSGRPYEIKAVFEGNDIYTYDYAYGEFYVISPDVIFEASDEYCWEFDGWCEYEFGLYDSAENLIKGYVDLYVNGMYYKTVKVGDDYTTIVEIDNNDILDSGVNKLTLSFNGTDFYNPANKRVRIIKYSDDTQFKCNLPVSTKALIGETVNITASLYGYETYGIVNEDFDVTLYSYEGVDISYTQSFTIQNGSGTVMLDTSDLMPDTYVVYIHHNGSAAYGPATYRIYDEDEGYLTPYIELKDKRPTSLSVEHDDTTTEGSMIFNFSLTDDWISEYHYDEWEGGYYTYKKIPNQTIGVYINDELFKEFKSDADKVLSENISGFKIGENEVMFVFNGTDIYDSSIYSTAVIYYPVISEIELEGFEEYQRYGKDLSFTAELKDKSTGEAIDDVFTVIVYDTDIYSSDNPIPLYQKNITTMGLINITEYVERGKEYTVTFIYAGNETVSPFEKIYNLYVTDDRIETFIQNEIPNPTISIGDDFIFNVNLYYIYESPDDYEYRDINAKVNVTIYLDEDYYENKDPIYSEMVNSNENITLDGSLFKGGEYYLISKYLGNDTLQPSRTYETFVVTDKKKAQIILEAEEAEYGRDENILVTLTDSQGDKLDYEIYVEILGYDDEWGYITVDKGYVMSGNNYTIPADELYQGVSYIVDASFDGNDEYMDSSERISFTVQAPSKGFVSINIDAPKTPLYTDVSINVTMEDDNGLVEGDLNVSIYEKYPESDDVPFYTTTAHSGEAFTVDADKFSEGRYYVMASFAGNDDYFAKKKIGNLIVSDRNPSSLWIDTFDITEVQDAYFDAFLYDQYGEDLYNRDVAIEIYTEGGYEAGEEPLYACVIAAGERGYANSSLFEAGKKYIVYGTFEGDWDYMPAKSHMDFTVQKDKRGEISIEADYPSAVYEDSVNMTVRLVDIWDYPYSADVDVYLNNELVDTIMIEEDGTDISLNGLEFGPNKVEFKFAGNKYYHPVSENANVLYTSKPVSIDIDATDDGVIIIVKDIDDNALANATVKVTVNGEESEKTTDEKGTIAVPVSGNATVKAVYTDENGQSVSGSIKIVETIKEVEVPVEVPVDVPVPTVANATLDVVVNDGAVVVTVKDLDGNAIGGAALSVVVDGVESNVTAGDDGTVSVPVSGNATVVVSYADALGSVASATVKVVENIKEVDVPVDVPVPTVANATLDVVVNDGAVVVTVKDLDGNAIGGAALSVVVDGVESNVTAGDDGTVSVPVSGNATVVVSYADALGSVASATVKVVENIKEVEVPVIAVRKATKIECSNMKTFAVDPKSDGKNGDYFIWRLVDEDGNPIANTPMQIGFNGKVYTYEEHGVCTDKDGYARLQINLGYKGDYTFAICFLGDDDYKASFAVAKITVDTQTGSLTVPNKSYKASAKTKALTAIFKTQRGKLAVGKKLTFIVNGKKYSATSNDQGVATVNVSLNKKGTYNFTVKYGGDSTYAAISQKGKLTIK